MGRIGKVTIASGLLCLASHVSAQVASVCQGQVCFKLNIPQNTASSGNGDIFFQISAPTSYEWVALGQGSRMSGSNMFVVYTSGSGNNVTLSPRLASGYTPPNFNGAAQVTLLEGSGVTNGKMVANVRCSNCNSWSGGTASFNTNSGSWVYAAHSSGGPKNSDSTSASIQQHDSQSAFNWDYANAKGGNSVNPLVNAAVPSGTVSVTPGATATNCVPRPQVSGPGGATGTGGLATPTQSSNDNTQTSGSLLSQSDWRTRGRPTASPTGRYGPPEKRQEANYCDDFPNGNSGLTPIGNIEAEMRKTRAMLIAHGVLAALAFVILFPAGAIAIRLASFPGIIWLHAVFQVFAYLVYIAAFGLGVYIANGMNLLEHRHAIIGIVVFALLFVQPIAGLLHHALYKKYRTRTFWSYWHIWVGRIAITLGIINGGLGLQLADSMGMSSKPGIIAYGVVAGVVWLAWAVAIVIGEKRRRVTTNDRPPKYSRSEGSGQTRESSRQTSEMDVQRPEHGHYAPRR